MSEKALFGEKKSLNVMCTIKNCTSGMGRDISKIPTQLDSAGQKQFFCVKKSIKKHDALLKIAKTYTSNILV
jgi:hypothetical protein